MTTWTRAAVVAIATVACAPRGPRTEVTEPGSLLIVTALRGTTEPCGCTSHPLGGLDRLAARIEAHRAAGASGPLIVGDTYFESSTSPEHARAEDEARAKVIAAILARLAPSGFLLGPSDAARGRNQPPTPQAVTLSGGLHVAVFTRPSLDAAACAALRSEAARTQADVRLLLLATDTPEARACESDVDVVVTPGGDDPRPPLVSDGTLWVDAAERGRYLGQLTFHNGPRGPWTFYDEARSARVTRDAKRERLRREIDALEDGPAKEARRAKLAALESEVIHSEKPVGRYVTWNVEAIDREVPPAGWATEALQGFNRSLCDITRAATSTRTCESAAVADQYVGNITCKSCHAAAFDVYDKTAHAHAWATLEAANKSCDLGCIGCHSVGYENAGGYCRLDDATPFVNVGCESCHGPGRGHAISPRDHSAWSTMFTRNPGAATCTGCHNPQHSDRFDFATYRPRILGPGHGAEGTPGR